MQRPVSSRVFGLAQAGIRQARGVPIAVFTNDHPETTAR